MDAFVGVLLGGLISLTTTLTVDLFRARRELRHRWDDDGLDAIEHFIEVANRTIGALYDEGRARHQQRPDPSEIVEYDRVARSQMDSLRVAHARARLILPPLHQVLDEYRAALGSLKDLADGGFAPDDARWRESQSELQRQLDAVLAAAGSTLGLRDV